jgi:hypothetical protein
VTPLRLLQTIIDPGLLFMTSIVGSRASSSPEARILLLAIAGQEGDFSLRRQVGGPARSYWQFESGGGVEGVLGHLTAGPIARQVCQALDLPTDRPTVFEAIAWNDALAVTMARLLLWTDPETLPAVGQTQAGWDYYERIWRPGKPGPDRWPVNYHAAMLALAAVPAVS